ncbi:hypothetical protein TARUN_9646 [Trichoderma arundinaceum]|uniref:Uncharacterized protein n=1 Tax=Trichoderma arundinaceum TaxID=490622 RepID=A0A395N908_TRIAR|nr:hypothetical protein TARUN_9646 [Trichoderma arundinaceum]
MEGEHSFNGGCKYNCGCACDNCAAGPQCPACFSFIPEDLASTSIQQTDLSSASIFPTGFPSTSPQTAGLSSASNSAFPAEFSPTSFQPTGVPFTSLQPTDLLSTDTLPANFSSAGFPATDLPLDGLLNLNTITPSTAPPHSLPTALVADTPVPLPASNNPPSQSITLESVTYTPSNQHQCPICRESVSYQQKGSLTRHLKL